MQRSEIAVPAPVSRRVTTIRSACDRLAVAMKDREFVAVAGFCGIGALLTASFLYSIANFDSLAAARDLMP